MKSVLVKNKTFNKKYFFFCCNTSYDKMNSNMPCEIALAKVPAKETSNFQKIPFFNVV